MVAIPANRWCDIWDGSHNGSGTYRLNPSPYMFYGDDDGSNNHERAFAEFDFPPGYNLDDTVLLNFYPFQGTALTIRWYFSFPTDLSGTQASPPGSGEYFVLGPGQQTVSLTNLVSEASMSAASKIVLAFEVANFSDVVKSIDVSTFELVDSAPVSDVKIWAGSSTDVRLTARLDDGSGPLYYGEANPVQTFITVPGAQPAETDRYIVTGQRKTAGVVDRIGSQIVEVEQSDVSSFFQTPGGTTVNLTIETEADAEYEIVPVDAFGYLANIVRGDADGSGDAVAVIRDAAAYGLSSVRYRVTARKRNVVDPTVIDWVRHGFVDVTDQNETVQIGAA